MWAVAGLNAAAWLTQIIPALPAAGAPAYLRGTGLASVQHIRDASPKDLPPADLYVFSSPGRFGKPKGNARRFP